MMRSQSDQAHDNYQEFYENLAEEDLASAIMEQEYAEALNENTAISLGNVRNKKGCDLGVGKGHLLKEMIGRGAKMTAVDIALPYLNALQDLSSLQRIQADAEHLPFRNEFDFITCTDVLEHVLNPGNLLYCINEALKPGGIAAIRVPADENLLLYSTHLGCKYEMVHLRAFSQEMVIHMLEGAGLKVRKIEQDGHSLSMLLPTACGESEELRNQTNQVRNMLSEHGVTPGELMKTPAWFKNQVSKPYVYLVIAEKTHFIKYSRDQGFVLNQIN